MSPKAYLDTVQMASSHCTDAESLRNGEERLFWPQVAAGNSSWVWKILGSTLSKGNQKNHKRHVVCPLRCPFLSLQNEDLTLPNPGTNSPDAGRVLQAKCSHHCHGDPVRQISEKTEGQREREHCTLDLRAVSTRPGSQVSPLELEACVHSDMALSLPG